MEYPDIQYFEEYIRFSVKDVKEISYNIFKQTWATTACGWAEPGSCAGQAITEDYTTIATITTESKPVYLVCFGDEMAYMITDPKIDFFEDATNHCMLSLYEAVNTNRY